MIRNLFVWLALVLAMASGLSSVASARPAIYGDEDPMPVSCVNFSGKWKSDDSGIYSIQQKKCNWLRIQTTMGSGSDGGATTIVPDGKTRLVEGDSWKATVRHRWDDREFGSTIQTFRNIEFEDHRVSETIYLEIANENLLLESTYRITVYRDFDEPKRESFQRIFRRAPSDSRGGKH